MLTNLTLADQREMFGARPPSPAGFTPTEAEPVFPFMLPSGSTVYGIVIMAYGLSGPSLTGSWNPVWHWYSDRNEAIRAGIFHEWTKSRPGKQFYMGKQADHNNPISPQDAARMSTMHVGSHDEHAIIAHRVRVLYKTDQWDWKLIRCPEEALQARYEALWDFRRYYGEIPELLLAADAQLDDFPEVLAYYYGDCPETDTELFKYGSLYCDTHDLFTRYRMGWWTERDKAEEARTRALERYAQRLEAEAKVELANEAFALYEETERELEELLSTDLYRRFKDEIPSFEDDLHTLWRSERISKDDEPELILERQTLAQSILTRIREALEECEFRILELLDDGRLVRRIREILKTHLSRCPLCKESCQYDDEWIERFVMLRTTVLPCNCPNNGWSLDDSEAPQDLRERDGLSHSCTELLTTVAAPGRAEIVVLRAIRHRKTTLISFGTSARTLNWQQPTAVLHLEQLLATATTERLKLVNVWATMRQVIFRTRRAELQARVASGELLELTFTWDQRRSCWSTRRHFDGVTTIYRVDKPYADDVREDVAYYCGHKVVQRACTETFRLVIVAPFKEVR